MASTPTDYEQAFVTALMELVRKQDRAALAQLRRGLGKRPGEAVEMFPWVVPWLPSSMSERRQDDFFLVAALFALHQENWQRQGHERTNLGASFRLLAERTGSTNTEARFMALLNAPKEDLSAHLRHAVAQFKTQRVPVDWARLLHDLRGWSWGTRSIQRAWAVAFWRS